MKHFDVVINYGSGSTFMPTTKAANAPKGGGILIELSDWEFVVLGTGFSVATQTREGACQQMSILRKEEGRYIKGQWKRGRILNGDEQMMLSSLGLMPEAMRFKLYEVKN